MVRLPDARPVLNRKLLRDLWEMKGQSLAIAAVIVAGVAMFVTYLSNFDSLHADARRVLRTRAVRRRVRVGQTRAGEPRAAHRGDPGRRGGRDPRRRGRHARRAGPRRAGHRPADLAAGARTAAAQRRLPAPRPLDRRRRDLTKSSRAKCSSTPTVCSPGDHVAAVINGRRRWLTIVGVGLSPEYVYAIRPGEMVPGQAAVRHFLDGPASLGLGVRHGGRLQRRLADARARRSGIRGHRRPRSPPRAVRRPRRHSAALQLSDWTLENELTQLQTFGFLLPLIFFGVAAFILNVALTRALALQRPQIAALKALGYSNRELAWHYLKWAMIIAHFR